MTKVPMIIWDEKGRQRMILAKDLKGFFDNPSHKDKIALISQIPIDEWHAPNKATPYLRICFGFHRNMFNEPERSLSLAMKKIAVAVLLIDKNDVPPKILKDLENVSSKQSVMDNVKDLRKDCKDES